MAPSAKQQSQSKPTIYNEWFELVSALHQSYTSQTPRKLQLIDLFTLFAILLAIVQGIYAVIAGTFPYNSFLAGEFCSIGFAVLLVCLRLQIANPKDFGNITAESAFAGFIIGNLALFSIVTTFMG